MAVCMHVYVSTSLIFMHTYMDVCVQVCVCTCLLAYVYYRQCGKVHVCEYAYMYIDSYMYVCMYA